MKRPDETKQGTRYYDFAMHGVWDELNAACLEFPDWPTDPLHAVAIIGEEYGELCKAVVDMRFFDKATREQVIGEATQTAAMCIRFIARLLEEPEASAEVRG